MSFSKIFTSKIHYNEIERQFRGQRTKLMRKKRTSIKKVNQATSRGDSIQKDKIINPRKLPYSHLINFSIKIYCLLTIIAHENKFKI